VPIVLRDFQILFIGLVTYPFIHFITLLKAQDKNCHATLKQIIFMLFVCPVIITYINCYSVNLATGVQNAFTAAKLVAVFVVVAGGVYKIIQGRTEHFRNYFENTTTSMGDVATAFYSGLWAYDGWNNLNYVTEEIKNPSK